MNANYHQNSVGRGWGIALALSLGILAALPSQAGSGTIKVTHAKTTAAKWATAAAAAPVARKPATPALQGPGEVQVGVMAAQTPQTPPARRSVFIHR